MTQEEIINKLMKFCDKNGYGYWVWNDYKDAVVAICEYFYTLGKDKK